MNLIGAKTLVTGAGGFIGSHVVEALHAAGAKVTAMIHYDARPDNSNLELAAPEVRNAIQVVAGNIEDPHFVSSAVAGQDVVLHLAALIAIPYSYLAPTSYVRTNVDGTLNVLEACRQHKVARLVHTSTSEVYGTALYTPIDEKHPLQGQSPYSATKIGADKLAESYWNSFGTPVATLRPFNTYGPRQSARAVVPTIISQALFSNQVRLGSLSPVRDLTYVADTAAAFLAVAGSEAAVGQVVNAGSGSAVTIGDLAREVLALVGRDIPIVLDEERLRPERSEVMQLIADNSKLRELTEWSPLTPLRKGLIETIEFVRCHPERFRPDVYNR